MGDKVVYPMHGAGVIERIEYKDLRGTSEPYYILHLPVGGMFVMLPEGSAGEVGLRPVIPAEEVPSVFGVLSARDEVEAQAWNRRYRANMERLRQGRVEEVARIVRDLARRERLKGLSTGERKMLDNARAILVSELALSIGCSEGEAEELINAALA